MINDILYQEDIKYKSSRQTPEYYEIPFRNEKGERAVTYVEPRYRNYSIWKEFVENPDKRYVITNARCAATKGGKLRKTKDGIQILDADSKIVIKDNVSDDIMDEFFKELDKNK